jgi:hypothetical protein
MLSHAGQRGSASLSNHTHIGQLQTHGHEHSILDKRKAGICGEINGLHSAGLGTPSHLFTVSHMTLYRGCANLPAGMAICLFSFDEIDGRAA